nr:MAG TPA: hypothetical protein [Bacteriophage sp.]
MIFSKITKTLIAMQIIAEFTAFPPFLAPPSAGAFFMRSSSGWPTRRAASLHLPSPLHIPAPVLALVPAALLPLSAIPPSGWFRLIASFKIPL